MKNNFFNASPRLNWKDFQHQPLPPDPPVHCLSLPSNSVPVIGSDTQHKQAEIPCSHCGSSKNRKKRACLQGSPTKNPKTQHDAELSCKSEAERSIHSGDILRKRIRQSNWQTEIGTKTQESNCSTAWNNWINLLFLWMSTQKQKISIISLFSLNANLILEISFGIPKCAWPHPYE